ncbi:MAG TPA: hypothetical protein VLC08_13300 [Chitinolyticbacter sp.]|nr:hypothetical protein [Chitinolyticbacter sp.]
MTLRAATFALLCVAPVAQAIDADDAALQLADQPQAPSAAPEQRDWRAYAEFAVGLAQPRAAAGVPDSARLSLDVVLDTALAPGWRLVLSDRLDGWAWSGQADRAVNTLREAYLGWQPDAQTAIDLGRVNVRYGAGLGYNPTDFFKVGALRSVTSADPQALRENRQGSVLLRGQRLWDGGALTAIGSPELGGEPSDDGISLNLGATNPADRWLLVASHRFSEWIDPQWLLYGEPGSVLAGMNWSVLLSDAMVGYVEFAGGRQPSLLARSQGRDDAAFRAAWVAGATWTTAFKLSVTVEYQRDNAAADADQWKALQNGVRQGEAADYARYRQLVGTRQALATRESTMLYASWQDAGVAGLDLSGYWRRDLVDASWQAWLQARWRTSVADLTAQWLYNHGEALSNYGAAPARQRWQLALTHYF